MLGGSSLRSSIAFRNAKLRVRCNWVFPLPILSDVPLRVTNENDLGVMIVVVASIHSARRMLLRQ